MFLLFKFENPLSNLAENILVAPPRLELGTQGSELKSRIRTVIAYVIRGDFSTIKLTDWEPARIQLVADRLIVSRAKIRIYDRFGICFYPNKIGERNQNNNNGHCY
jgi:hypothetical protein